MFTPTAHTMSQNFRKSFCLCDCDGAALPQKVGGSPLMCCSVSISGASLPTWPHGSENISPVLSGEIHWRFSHDTFVSSTDFWLNLYDHEQTWQLSFNSTALTHIQRQWCFSYRLYKSFIYSLSIVCQCIGTHVWTMAHFSVHHDRIAFSLDPY